MRKRIFRKLLPVLLLFLCAVLLIAAMPTPVLAADAEVPKMPEVPDISGARSVYLYNYESDKVMAMRSTGEKIAPASVVKIVTGMVALGILGNRMEDEILLTQAMLDGVEGSRMGLEVGMNVQIRDLFYGMLCGGYNDPAQALAILCSGSVPAFVEEMNRYAASIGCSSTYFTNPTGLDDNQMLTTLSDVILIANAAVKDKTYMQISSAPSYLFLPGGSVEQTGKTIHNRNSLISSYYYQGYQNRYAQGLIAGMTESGGWCVVTYAKYDTASYLCIVMGASATDEVVQSFRIADNLLDYAIGNFSVIEYAKAGTEICRIPVKLAMPDNVKDDTATIACTLPTSLVGLIPDIADPKNDISYRYYLYRDEITAPVKKGTVVGGVDVYYGEEWLCHSPLVAGKDMEINSFLKGMDSMKHFFFNRATLIALIAFVILCLVYFLWLERLLRRKRYQQSDFKRSPN